MNAPNYKDWLVATSKRILLTFAIFTPVNAIFWIILQWHQNRILNNSTVSFVSSAKETVGLLIHAATLPNIVFTIFTHLFISSLIIFIFFPVPYLAPANSHHKGDRP